MTLSRPAPRILDESIPSKTADMRDKQDEDLSKQPDEQPNGHFAQGESQPLHRKHVNSDSSEIREVASQFVSDLIYRAKEVAQRQQSCIEEEEEEEEEDMPPPRRILDLSAGPAKTPPEIQIDLVGSRTPSPEEEVTYVAPEPNFKKKKVILQDDRSDDSESASDSSVDATPRRKLLPDDDCRDIADLKNDPELRDFAVAYIKGILEQAALLAQERAPGKAEELISENSALKKAAGPWYSRIRAAVTRCLRTGCFCVVRRQSSS